MACSSNNTSHLSSISGEEVDKNGGITSNLPTPTQRRIQALKKLQVESSKLDIKYYTDVHALETKYSNLYQPFLEKRRQIVCGEYEPTEEEYEFPLEEDEYCFVKYYERMKTEGEMECHIPVKGIPGFWYQIFRNVEMLEDMVSEADVPILKHLTDIQYTMSNEPMSYTLIFHFSKNDYFQNSILTKTYEMKPVIDTSPLNWFSGLEIYKTIGCDIEWYPNQNITIRISTEKRKKKEDGSVEFVQNIQTLNSFFNFFTPPNGGLLLENNDDKSRFHFNMDTEIAKYIRERIVGRAVLFYTGEATHGVNDIDTSDLCTTTEEEEEEEETGENQREM